MPFYWVFVNRWNSERCTYLSTVYFAPKFIDSPICCNMICNFARFLFTFSFDFVLMNTIVWLQRSQVITYSYSHRQINQDGLKHHRYFIHHRLYASYILHFRLYSYLYPIWFSIKVVFVHDISNRLSHSWSNISGREKWERNSNMRLILR